MKVRNEYRIYPFDSPGQVAGGLLSGLSFAGALALSQLYGSSFWSTALLVVSFGIMILYIAPRMIAWLLSLVDVTVQAQAEYKATTPEVLAIDARIELERERRRNLQELRMLDSDHIKYALNLLDMDDLINIQGATVRWVVEGQSIPVDFAIEWMEAYRARPGNQLPAQADFAGSPDRDNKRRYARAISQALMRAGYVRDSGGPIPPRWVIQDESIRNAALASIGLELAYDMAYYLAQKSGGMYEQA